MTALLDEVKGETPLMLAAEGQSLEVLECVAHWVSQSAESAERARVPDAARLAVGALRFSNLEVLETCFPGSIPHGVYRHLASTSFNDGMAPLALALHMRLTNVVHQLLKAGANPMMTTRLPGVDPPEPSTVSWTCLDVAVQSGCSGHISLFDDCLKAVETSCYGVDSSTPAGGDDWLSHLDVFDRLTLASVTRCLIVSCRHGADDFVRALLRKLAGMVGRAIVSAFGVSSLVKELGPASTWSEAPLDVSPLRAATRSGAASCVQLLLSAGFKPSAEDRELARECGNPSVLSLFQHEVVRETDCDVNSWAR